MRRSEDMVGEVERVFSRLVGRLSEREGERVFRSDGAMAVSVDGSFIYGRRGTKRVSTVRT